MDNTILSQKFSAGSFSALLTNLNSSKHRAIEATTYRAWSVEDDLNLKTYLGEGKTKVDIAKLLDRTTDAITSRMRKLGIKRYKEWSDNDDSSLKMYLLQGKRKEEIASLLNRTPYAVSSRMRKLNLKIQPNITNKQLTYIEANFSLYGPDYVAKKLKLSKKKVCYEANKLGLTYKRASSYNPPIPKNLLPYHMVKRVSLLDRDCPSSKNKVDDCVIVLYDKMEPSTPMMAMHLDELLMALEKHFGRRAGVVTGALLSGYKA